MNYRKIVIRSVLFLSLAIVALVAAGLAVIVIDPQMCYDEHLRHDFDNLLLVTPDDRIENEQSTSRRWGVEYSAFDDARYEDVYMTPAARGIIRIRPYARPALTVGFHLGVEVESPSNLLVIEPDLAATAIEIAGEAVGFDLRGSGNPIDLHDGLRDTTYYEYDLEFHVPNDVIEGLSIEDDDRFRGRIEFTIDGEPYSFEFASTLRYERRMHGCFGVPGMP